jgi:hypothetical protein
MRWPSELRIELLYGERPPGLSGDWKVSLADIPAESESGHAYQAELRTTDDTIAIFTHWDQHSFVIDRANGRVKARGRGRRLFNSVRGVPTQLQAELIGPQVREDFQ